MVGTKNVLSKLDAIVDAVQNDVPARIDKEMSYRRDQVEEGFDAAEYHDTKDVTVTLDKGEKEWTITASGESVLFIEYGTGIKFKHDSEFGNYQDYPPTSWSLGPNGSGWLSPAVVKKQYGRWFTPAGVKTYGEPSANVMYEVMKRLSDRNLTNILERVVEEAYK